MKTALSGSFSRLNPRERALVYSLLAVVALGVVVGGVWYVTSHLSSKEEAIRQNQQAFSRVRALAGPYLEKQAKSTALLEQIRKNEHDKNPDSPVAEVAVKSKVRYMAGSGGEEQEDRMDKLLVVTGDLYQKALTGGKKRRKRGGPTFYRVEKQFNMNRGFARTEDLWSFLAEVEKLRSLVFVSKLSIHRWSRDPDFAQIKNLTASTVRWVEEEAEE